jgi:hypothetical protein
VPAEVPDGDEIQRTAPTVLVPLLLALEEEEHEIVVGGALARG